MIVDLGRLRRAVDLRGHPRRAAGRAGPPGSAAALDTWVHRRPAGLCGRHVIAAFRPAGHRADHLRPARRLLPVRAPAQPRAGELGRRAKVGGLVHGLRSAGSPAPGSAGRRRCRWRSQIRTRVPRPGCGLQLRLAAVGHGDGLHDGQAQAAAAASPSAWPAGRAGLVRGPVRSCARWNRSKARAASGSDMPGPGVRDLHHRPAAHRGEPDRDRGARRRVLADVAEQVGQHLPDPGLVHHRDQPVRCLGLDRAVRLAPPRRPRPRPGPARPGRVSVRSSEEVRSSRASSSSSATSVLIRCASCSIRRIAFGSWSGPSAPCRYSSA